MLQSITFKTELEDILTQEEVVVLFDSIKRKYEFELITLSLFPKFNKLREEVLRKTIVQRNAELSQLLMEIANRKQEIKMNIWKKLSTIAINKKTIQNNLERAEDLEQIIYEEEQIIGIYENSIKTLERKEKKIMNGKYSKVDRIKFIKNKRTLKKQLTELRDKISEISEKHDNCFVDCLNELDNLVEESIISSKTKFPRNLNKMVISNYANSQSIKIEDSAQGNTEEKMCYERIHALKDFYLYEPNEENLDDELIFQLLAQGKYDPQGGTINSLSLITEIEEV